MSNYTPQEIEAFLRDFFDVVGTRQYIGARYVPIFGRQGEATMDWDNSAPYEPLTIVLYQNDSYTSRTYVPQGVAITDTSYWVKTGAYNAQVEAYRHEVIELYGSWADYQEAMAGEWSDYKDEMETWKSDTIDDFEQAIDEIPEILPSTAFTPAHTVADAIDGTRKMLVIAIGDSYGQGYTPDGATQGWCQRLGYRLGHLGFDYRSAYQGGASFGNGVFLAKLQDVVGTLTEDERKDCKMVLVAGGYNDRLRTQSEIITGMQNFAAYVKSNLPNSQVFVSFIGSCVTGLTNGDHQGATWTQCVETVSRYLIAATGCGFAFDGTGVGVVTRNEFFSSDYVHPNANGLEIITDHLVSSINGTCYIPNRYKDCYTANIVADGEHITNAAGNYMFYFERNTRGTPCNLNFGSTNQWCNFSLSYSEAQTFTDAWTITIGHVYSAGFTGLTYKVPCLLVLRYEDDGHKYIEGPAYLVVHSDGSLVLHFSHIRSDRGGYETLTPTWMSVKSIGDFAI